METLKNAAVKVVGTKQVLRALKKAVKQGRVRYVEWRG